MEEAVGYHQGVAVGEETGDVQHGGSSLHRILHTH